MRLINVHSRRLEEFIHGPTPSYAILSHTWGRTQDELTFQELQDGAGTDRQRYKIDRCCEQAAEDGLGFAWIDTCCIDKTSTVELSEAINSMFRWYQQANVCYAFLSDVAEEEQLPESRWFRRGWTLQELLAPGWMKFYGAEWVSLGTKRQLASALSSVTNIPRPFLMGAVPTTEASIAQRMSWAANRETTRPEDIAYCLLGIFGISMPMIYGEGERAFARLQEEIMRHDYDDSMFAWQVKEGSRPGILATSPADFAGCGDIARPEREDDFHTTLEVVGGTLKCQRQIESDVDGQLYLRLHCFTSDGEGKAIGIPVDMDAKGPPNHYVRSLSTAKKHFDRQEHRTDSTVVWVRGAQDFASSQHNVNARCHLENTLASHLEVVSAEPSAAWDSQTETISFTDQIVRVWLRLRQKTDLKPGSPTPGSPGKLVADPDRKDFITLVQLHRQNDALTYKHVVLTAKRAAPLNDIVQSFHDVPDEVFDKRMHTASNEHLHLQVDILLEMVGRQQICFVRLAKTASAPVMSIDATDRMQKEGLMVALEHAVRNRRRVGRDNAILESGRAPLLLRNQGLERNIAELDAQIARLQEERDALVLEREGVTKDLETRSADILRGARRGEHYGRHITELQAQLRGLPLDSLSGTSWLDTIVQRLLTHYRLTDHACIDDQEDAKTRLLILAMWHDDQATINFLLGADDVISLPDAMIRVMREAVLRGDVDVASWLLPKGVQIGDLRRDNESAPLLWAVHENHLEMVQFLLFAGVGVDESDSNFWTPLHFAAYKGHAQIVEMLLEHGADRKRKGRHGQTPLDIATQQGHEAVITMLGGKKETPQLSPPKSPEHPIPSNAGDAKSSTENYTHQEAFPADSWSSVPPSSSDEAAPRQQVGLSYYPEARDRNGGAKAAVEKAPRDEAENKESLALRNRRKRREERSSVLSARAG